MKRLKKLLKIIWITLLFLLIGFYIFFYAATAPKSDEKVLSSFKEMGSSPIIKHKKFRSFDYRELTIERDTALPTIIFVHGTIGSVLDFRRYMTDSLLQKKANMIVYDRIGYNYEDEHDVQESIAFEVEMLESISQEVKPEKTILVGYSYGGPIVLASKKKYKKVVLLAPAVYSKVEPMPWMLNLYKWKLTRWIVPPVWKQASKEKLSHPSDLKKFEHRWIENPNSILSIHGDADWIVPYANSEYLKKQFPENQFSLVTLKDAGHGLIWMNFSEIKQQLLKQID